MALSFSCNFVLPGHGVHMALVAHLVSFPTSYACCAVQHIGSGYWVQLAQGPRRSLHAVTKAEVVANSEPSSSIHKSENSHHSSFAGSQHIQPATLDVDPLHSHLFRTASVFTLSIVSDTLKSQPTKPDVFSSLSGKISQYNFAVSFYTACG
jgi:hypothetical protein